MLLPLLVMTERRVPGNAPELWENPRWNGTDPPVINAEKMSSLPMKAYTAIAKSHLWKGKQ